MASLGATAANAQTRSDPTRSRTGQKSNTIGQTVEGTVKSVRGNMVTLEDGTELTIPAGVKVAADQLKPGTQITAEYRDRAGHKIAKSVEIKG
jgi:hypothetical protein